jgi:hypothetical protein
VNEDLTYFVAGDTTSMFGVLGCMMEELGDDDTAARTEAQLMKAKVMTKSTANISTTSKARYTGKKGGRPSARGTGGAGSGVDGGDRKGFYSVLHYAAAECDSDVVQALINGLGAQVFVNRQDATGCTPLHWAASAGKLGNVELLVDAGADDSMRNYMGLTPLEWTQKRNRTRIADQLKQIGEKTLGGKFMDRDDGACAEKINAHEVMATVSFLKDRKARAEDPVDIARVHRHMKHALARGHPLTSFSQQLLRYELPALDAGQAQTAKLKRLMHASLSSAGDGPLVGSLEVKGLAGNDDKEWWCYSKDTSGNNAKEGGKKKATASLV